MRCLALPLSVLALVSTSTAQERLELDLPVSHQFLITDPRGLQPCDLGSVVAQIGHALKLPVGFETTTDCSLGLRGTPKSKGEGIEDLKGLSPRGALDYLLTFMPAFSWRDVDGAIVVRPKRAWDDPGNLLNGRTAAFYVINQPLDDVIHTLFGATKPPMFVSHEDVANPDRPVNKRVTMQFAGGSVLEALNAVARTRRGLDWKLGYGAGLNHAYVLFGTSENNEGIVLAPVLIPPAAR